MVPWAPMSYRQDMAKCHREFEAQFEAFGETITRGVLVSF